MDQETKRARDIWENMALTEGVTDALVEKKAYPLGKTDRLRGMRGDARLYELDPPMRVNRWAEDDVTMTRYVVVSAVVAFTSGPETYIFASDNKGNITDWLELEGSFKGDLDHEKALYGAGYTIHKRQLKSV